MTKYADIIERLEKVTGPNFDLECKIKAATGDEFLRVPTYTASIDEAIALAERMLPTQWPTILRTALSAMAKEYDWHITFPKPGQRELLPLAILLALFRALEAKEGG